MYRLSSPLLLFPVSSPYTSWMVSPSRPLRSLFRFSDFPPPFPFLVVIFALIHPLLPPRRPSYIRTLLFLPLTPHFHPPKKLCAPHDKGIGAKKSSEKQREAKTNGGKGTLLLLLLLFSMGVIKRGGVHSYSRPVSIT